MPEAVRSIYGVIKLVDEVTRPLKQVNQAMDEVKKSTRGLIDRINEARESLLLIGGALSAIGYGGFRFFRDATKDLADFQDAMRVFRNYAGENADAILKAMEEAAEGTIDSTQMILNANRAIVMGIDPEYLPEMMRIARAAARAMGTDVQYMFESIAVGTARQSKLILDNLGIIVDAEAAYEKYAKSIGKTAEQLTEAEKRQAFLMAVMESGRKLVDKVDLSQETLNETLMKSQVAWREFKKELAEGALPVIKGFAEAVERTTTWLKNLPKPAKVVIGTLGVLATAISGTVGPMMLHAAAIGYLVANYAQIKAGLALARVAMLGFASSVWAAMAPLLPYIAIISAIIGAILLLQHAWVHNWFGIRDKTIAAINAIRGAIDWLVSGIRTLIDWITSIPSKIAEAWKIITENPIFKAAQTVFQFTPAGAAMKAIEFIQPRIKPIIEKPEMDKRFYEEGSIILKVETPKIKPEIEKPKIKPEIQEPEMPKSLLDIMYLRIKPIMEALALPKLPELVASVRYLPKFIQPEVRDLVAGVKYIPEMIKPKLPELPELPTIIPNPMTLAPAHQTVHMGGVKADININMNGVKLDHTGRVKQLGIEVSKQIEEGMAKALRRQRLAMS